MGPRLGPVTPPLAGITPDRPHRWLPSSHSRGRSGPRAQPTRIHRDAGSREGGGALRPPLGPGPCAHIGDSDLRPAPDHGGFQVRAHAMPRMARRLGRASIGPGPGPRPRATCPKHRRPAPLRLRIGAGRHCDAPPPPLLLPTAGAAHGPPPRGQDEDGAAPLRIRTAGPGVAPRRPPRRRHASMGDSMPQAAGTSGITVRSASTPRRADRQSP